MSAGGGPASSSSTPAGLSSSSSSSSSAGHAEVKSLLHQRLIESGEKERLKEHLKTRLVECGWRDQLKLSAKEIIRQKGLEHVKLDELIAEITPKGRASVPDAVKRELLARIKEFLAQQENI